MLAEKSGSSNTSQVLDGRTASPTITEKTKLGDAKAKRVGKGNMPVYSSMTAQTSCFLNLETPRQGLLFILLFQ